MPGAEVGALRATCIAGKTDENGTRAMDLLSGMREIEIAGIGPGPFCGMMFSDMGVDVIRLDRVDGLGEFPFEKNILLPDPLPDRGRRNQ